mgnify:CR=1 FL=1
MPAEAGIQVFKIMDFREVFALRTQVPEGYKYPEGAGMTRTHLFSAFFRIYEIFLVRGNINGT